MRFLTVLKPIFSRPGMAAAALCLSTWASAQDGVDAENDWLNAFDQARSEQLIQEGQLLMREGQFDTAERAFVEAMQIAKINFGLDSTEQRLALEHAIEAQLAQGKWEQVENHLSYFEWLNDQVYTRDFYDYLRGTEQLSSLLLRASADTQNPLGVRYLIAAKNLNWRAVTGIEATLGESSPELAPWLYNIVLTHFYQTSLLKRGGMSSYVYRNDENEEIAGWTLNLGDSLRISYRIGRELLERITAIYEQADRLPAESAALAIVYQADWEMLFGNEDDALSLYTSAYEELLASGLSESQVDQYFSQPTALPAIELQTSITSLAANQQTGPIRFDAWTPNYPATAVPSERVTIRSGAGEESMALVRFDLHPLLPSDLVSNGRTLRLGFNLADLEVLRTSPDNELIRERARREVSLLQFRPKLEAGEPVSFEDIELEYHFPPQYSNVTVSGN